MSTVLTTPGSGLMQRLKDATAELHRHAETRELQKALIKGSATPSLYRSYLLELHAIHATLERALGLWCDARPELAAVFTEEQRRTHDIELDVEALAALGHAEPLGAFGATTQAANHLVAYLAEHAVDEPFALIGCLYVLEGSMNGNRFLARALAKAWRLGERNGLRYLDPYGDSQQAKWQAFRTVMDALIVEEREIEAALDAACATFQAIAQISDEVFVQSAKHGSAHVDPA